MELPQDNQGYPPPHMNTNYDFVTGLDEFVIQSPSVITKHRGLRAAARNSASGEQCSSFVLIVGWAPKETASSGEAEAA
jgi:hypothetical protein